MCLLKFFRKLGYIRGIVEIFPEFQKCSGNFGNIFSARIAKFMGLPIDRLHIVTNENDILHRSINTGEMKILKVKQTYSPSMDIQISSNFERQLFESSKRNSEFINDFMQSFLDNGSGKIPLDILKDLKLIYNLKKMK